MKMVIEIPDRLIKKVKDHYVNPYEVDEICEAILDGTPLPEHHGRLIDADELEEKVEKHREMLKISEYDRELVLHYTDIEMAPTIIEGSESE